MADAAKLIAEASRLSRETVLGYTEALRGLRSGAMYFPEIGWVRVEHLQRGRHAESNSQNGLDNHSLDAP